ncbi:MAG: cytochrome c [Burkholderiales bacterium]|nr:cytochrome c [Burkholderiales bacterium]
MGKIILWMLVAFGAVSATASALGAIAYYGGFIDVSADTPHAAIVYDFIAEARDRSIERQIREIRPPADLSDPERVLRGAGNYRAMCANCHLSPGMANSEIRRGLYPTPPDLTKTSNERVPAGGVSARRFWVIKHGIKASAMPAWSKGGMKDSAIWDLTAFLGRLPALTPEQYKSMVAASDGHAHDGLSRKDHGGTPARGHVDKPGSRPHTH